jgi:hypothetical protein
MTASNNDYTFIHNMSNLRLQVIFVTKWASIDVGSQRQIDWDDSRHIPLWQFNLPVELQRPATEVLDASLLIKFFAVRPNMRRAQLGKT